MPWQQSNRLARSSLIAIVLGAIFSGLMGCSLQVAKTLVEGDDRKVLPRATDRPSAAPYPDLLILALDGVDRQLLYDLLQGGELPELAALLGGQLPSGEFLHAHFSDRLLSTLPSSTATAWASAFTGVSPSEHGVVGNEYFIRESGEFAAPIATTVDGTGTKLGTYNDGYFNKLLSSPTVYEQIRSREPNVLIWVALQQIFAGADRLLITDRSILFTGLSAWLTELVRDNLTAAQSHEVIKKLDSETIDEVVESLGERPAPDILTVYIAGTDKIAHVDKDGPTLSRQRYLRETLDAKLGELRRALTKAGALENRYVVVVSDHGHTEVLHDERHSLAKGFDSDPPAVLKAAGFTLRPFEIKVADSTFFDSVLAYQGAMAYVYLADRSQCLRPSSNHQWRCNWAAPPRYFEDVMAAAEAFYQASEKGSLVPALRGTLHAILVRQPEPFFSQQNEFVVYLGRGRTQGIKAWLAANPQPRYVKLAERLAALSTGRHGARAGDIILIANNGNVDEPSERYYFAAPYKSWHGSPSRQDAEVPLIVAHPQKTQSELRRQVNRVVANGAGLDALTQLLISLRFSSARASTSGISTK